MFVFSSNLGTNLLSADPNTGAVTVVQDIDRESLSENDLRLIVSVQDEPKDGQREPNVVKVPISVIILDENDNQPMFRGLPYKVRAHHMFSRILNFLDPVSCKKWQKKSLPRNWFGK